LVVTQLFDLNARIQQLTWSLIFYEKYSTSLSYLWFWPALILGGSVISAGTIHDLRRVKVLGTGPLWNPCFINYSQTCIKRSSLGKTRGSVGWSCVAHLSFCFEETWYRTFHRCFLPNCCSFGFSVSEETIF
jgi:hypothetical protein